MLIVKFLINVTSLKTHYNVDKMTSI